MTELTDYKKQQIEKHKDAKEWFDVALKVQEYYA